MTGFRGIARRRLAAVLAASCLCGGLATAAAGTAQAAVPDHWGFAFVNHPSVPGIPDLTHQAGSWPAPFHVHVSPGAVGQVFVRFPRIASAGGVVHVTAVIDAPDWCQAQTWGPVGVNEVVAVRCFTVSVGVTVPVSVPFTIMYSESSKAAFPPGRAYGYMHYRPGPGIVARFNSAGASDTVTSGPVGVWVVKMPGLGSLLQAGDVQVTAVDPTTAALCELSGWTWSVSGQRFVVRCYDNVFSPYNTGWTLSYQRLRASTGAQPKLFAYTFDNKPLAAGPYAPVPPQLNFNSAGAVNTIRAAGSGLRLVQFPRVGALPSNLLVTAFQTGPGICNLLTLWATSPSSSGPNVTVRDVACYTDTGTPMSQSSLISYTSAP
jgi:hypothetical protein